MSIRQKCYSCLLDQREKALVTAKDVTFWLREEARILSTDVTFNGLATDGLSINQRCNLTRKRRLLVVLFTDFYFLDQRENNAWKSAKDASSMVR